MDIFGVMVDGEELVVQESYLDLPKVPPQQEFQLLKWEKEYLGVYVSKHPLEGLGKYIKKMGAPLVYEINSKRVGEEVTLYGLLGAIRSIVTKGGDAMASFEIEDPSGKIEAVAFPRIYAQIAGQIVADKFVKIKGKIESRRDLQIIVNEVKGVNLDQFKNEAVSKGFYDPTEIFIPEEEPEVENLDTENSDVLVDEPLLVESEGKPTRDSNFVFSLLINKSLPQDKLMSVKELIKNNPGNVPVELSIEGADGQLQKLRLKQGVNLTSELEADLHNALKL